MLLSLQNFRKDYGTHFRETIQLSIPVIIGQLGQYLMGFIDNLMIGQLSYVHLSAASLANIMFYILTILGMGITFAISPLVAEANGAKDHRKVGDYLKQGLWVATFASIILGAAVYFSSWVIPFMEQPEKEVGLAVSYTKILSYSVLPMMIFLIAKQFADGLSLTRPAMFITLIGLAFNTFANWILIFGQFGMPRMELDGAGYGTLTSRSLMAILMIGYVLWHKRFRIYEVTTRWMQLNGRIIRKILGIGLPSGMQYFFEVAAFGGCTIMIGWMEDGSAYRATHVIALQMAALAYMVVLGTSAGASIRVGTALGRKDYINVRRAGFTGVILATGFMIIVGIVFSLGNELFPSYFIQSNSTEMASDNELMAKLPLVAATASKLMFIAALFAVFDGVQAVGVGILRGIQDVKIPTWITFFAYWVINLPLGYFLAFTLDMQVYGVWWGFVVALAFASVALLWRYNWLTKALIQEQEHEMQSANAASEEAKSPNPAMTTI
ncbi:MAG: MATE family efflux transporter [Bacteroidota bacterium]